MPLAVCATPIGNLEDVTPRVLDELRAADVVLAEDTRHTRLLLDRYAIAARLVSLHEHNEAARAAELVPRLLAGERMALVSDAGMPLVSDPGAPKGEITLVIGPAAGDGGDGRLEAAVAAVAELVAAGTPRRAAADVVSRLTGVGRNALYRANL
jgi:16S rRNA (cytidine1402-2'-O)-methyltransferase